MPQRQLSAADWTLVLRIILDVQHLLTVLDGSTVVERGVAPVDADTVTSHVLDARAYTHLLELAARTLGFELGLDPFPPQIRDQLAELLGIPPPQR